VTDDAARVSLGLSSAPTAVVRIAVRVAAANGALSVSLGDLQAQILVPQHSGVMLAGISGSGSVSSSLNGESALRVWIQVSSGQVSTTWTAGVMCNMLMQPQALALVDTSTAGLSSLFCRGAPNQVNELLSRLRFASVLGTTCGVANVTLSMQLQPWFDSDRPEDTAVSLQSGTLQVLC